MPFTPLNKLQVSTEVAPKKKSSFTPLSALTEVSEPTKIDSLRLETDFLQQKALEAEKHATLSGWTADTAKGFKEAFYDDASAEDVPFVGGGVEAYHLGELYQISEKVKDGTATTDEKKKLADYFAKNEEEAQKREDNVGYYLGSGLRKSLQFGLEIAGAVFSAPATAGTSIGALVVQKGALKTAKEVAKKMIADKVVREAMQKELTQYGVKVGAKGLVVAGSTGIAHVPADTLSRMIGDPTFGQNGELVAVSDGQPIDEAMLNAVSSHLVEVGSEFTGGLFTGLGRAGKTALTKAGILKAITKNNPNITPTQAGELFKRIGWNGVLEEFGEERVADATNEVLYQLGLGDQEFKMPTMRDLALELISFGIMGSGMKVLEKGLNSTIYKGKTGTENTGGTEDTGGDDGGTGGDDGGTGGDDVVQKNAEVLADLVRSKLEAGATPNEITLELSSQVDTQEAKDFVESVVKKAIADTKQTTTDAVAETQQKLDALLEKVSEAKTAQQANKLLEQALEQGTITQKKLDRIRELVPALAVDKATTPTKTKQPTAKKSKEGKTPTGEEVKPTVRKSRIKELPEGYLPLKVIFRNLTAQGFTKQEISDALSYSEGKELAGIYQYNTKDVLENLPDTAPKTNKNKAKKTTDTTKVSPKKKPETKTTEKTKSGEPKAEEDDEEVSDNDIDLAMEQAEDVAQEVAGTGKEEDEDLDTEDNKKDNKDDETNEDNTDSGSETDTGGTPEPVPLGTGTPDDTGEPTTGTGKSKRGQPERGLDSDGVQSGDGLGAELTNEEIQAEVEKYTKINKSDNDQTNGVVVLTKKVDEHILDVANRYKSGGESKQGRGILDEYYTHEKIVELVGSLLSFPAGKPIKVLEPSVGTGNFLYALPERDRTVKAHEINPTTARIAKIFHNGVEVTTQPFEATFMDERGNKKEFTADYDLVIGNPPYGDHRGKYLGLGEEKNISRYEDYFIKRGLDTLKEGGVLAMVVPSGFVRSSSRYSKEVIAKTGKLVRAFRFPNGVFSNTDVGTDILIFEKTGNATTEEQANRLALMVGDGYFTENPSSILGEQGTRKGQYGDEAYVKGNLEDAIERFGQIKDEVEAIAILKEAGITPTPENVTAVEELIEETSEEKKDEAVEELKKQEEAKKKEDEAKKKEAEKKGKEIIKKKIVTKVKSTGKVVPLDDYFDGAWTKEELAEWADTLPDGSLQNPEKHSGNFYKGKYYNAFNYARGDIYGKLDELEEDKNKQKDNPKFDYERQKKLLMDVRPTPETVENITISPDHAFLREYDTETGLQTIRQPRYDKDGNLERDRDVPNSLVSQFTEWLNDIPSDAFADSNKWEVLSFVRGEKVTGTDKNRNQKIKSRRERVANSMFKKYLLELSEDQKTKIENAFNRTYNSYYTPSFAGVPMVSQVNASMYPLKDSQKEGVGRAVVDGVLLGAHEVGFGKTTTGVLTAHELIARKWSKRPLIVVPKPVTKQWIETITKFLPNAKLNNLGNLGKGFVGDLSSLKIEEGSITIVTMEGFKQLGFTQETYNKLAMEYGYIASPQFETERKSEKSKASAETFTGAGAKGTRADITFESLGVDALIIDEVQKANHIVSKAKPPKGTSNRFGGGGDFTQTPSSLGIKTWLASQYVQMTMGRNVYLLSATPFTNKPIEFFSVLSLIGKEQLTRMGFMNVNNFFGMFFEVEERAEFKPDGSHDVVSRIRRIKNFRQWRQLLGSLVDFRLDDPSVIRPNKSEITYHVPSNEMTREMFSRAQEIFADKDEEARALVAIDQFAKIAFSPYASDRYSTGIDSKEYKKFIEDSPKLKTMLANVAQNKKDRPDAGQIIYSEVGKDFFPMIKSYLVKEMGYKESEVGIITSGNPSSQDKIDEIQKDYNAGKIKVLIGSKKISVGMNLQMNTTDMHLLTLPWNFLDLRQIHGRAWRQNNMWKNVRINYYLMQGSGDIHRSQTLANKQKLYESAIAEDANEVDIADVDHEAEALSLAKPEVRAKLELSGEIAKLGLQILQEEAEIAFSTRKLGKINQIQKELDSARKGFATEDKNYKEAIANGEEADDYWLKHHGDKMKRLEKELKEELDKLAEKGIDPTTLLQTRETSQKKVDELKKEKEDKLSSLDERIKALVASLPPEETFSNKFVEAIVAERAEANKTFYSKLEDEKTETVKVVKKTKEIKNGKGVVVKKKETTKVVKTTEDPKKPKSRTKDQAMLKILTDPNMSVKDKITNLLDKKQEGKKHKDAGERVAGSKKENAVIRAIIEHGNDELLRQLANELGNEAILAQLDKGKLTEDMEVPTAEVEKKKKTPAFIASYKVNVFNRIARTPELVRKSGRYSRERMVDEGAEGDFIAQYPEAFRKFVKDLNDISTVEQADAFRMKYRNDMFTVLSKASPEVIKAYEKERDDIQNPENTYKTLQNRRYIQDETERNAEIDRLNYLIENMFQASRVNIDTLGHNFFKTMNTSNVSMYSGKFTVDAHQGAFYEYGKAKENLEFVEKGGASENNYSSDKSFQTISGVFMVEPKGKDPVEVRIYSGRYKNLVEADEALNTALKKYGVELSDFLRAVRVYSESVMKILNEDYDKFLPEVESGKAKQIKDAEQRVEDNKKVIENTEKELAEAEASEAKSGEKKTGWGSAVYLRDRLKKHQIVLKEAEAFLARLKGETKAIEHGNFETIDEYDVKDSRFKKSFVNTTNLMKVYGFRTAQLGNYMDNTSGDEHIVQTMGAVEDMGKILKIDFPKMIQQMGLSIAFGARGGGKFLAHFEPTAKIINITKKRGDGSFGHEFMHAMDWLLGSRGRGSGRWSSTSRTYDSIASSSPYYITKALNNGVQVDFDTEYKPTDMNDAKLNDSNVKRFIELRSDGKSMDEAKATINTGIIQQWELERQYQALADVYRKPFTAKTKKRSNQYYENSKKYGGGKDTSYWVRNEELWARAFQAYLEDKMAEAGIKNNYLTRGTIGIDVYPQGEERKEYNKMFDELFELVANKFPRLPQYEEGSELQHEPRFKTKGEPQIVGTDGNSFLADVKQRLNLDFDVIWVDSILSQDGGAWGVTHDNAIAIAKDAPKWTAEHETVHLTTANLNKIPIFQRNGITREKLLTAQAQQMGIPATTANLRDIEEGLAEGFEQFMEGKSKATGVVRKFFNLLKLLVARLAKAVRLTDGNIILDYYDILAHGEEVDNKMVVMEREGILEAFIKDGTMTIPALGAQFKTTGAGESMNVYRKTVYHGTASKFSKFDKTKIGETTGTGDWGDGFYFTDSKDVARSFANEAGGDIVMEVHLKDLKFADGNKLEKLPEVQAILDDGMGFGDIGEYLKSKGYDGVKYKHSGDGGTEYVVYDPAQLTEIKNNNLRFKLKGEKDGKIANLKVRHNDAMNELESAEVELENSKDNVASEEDAHEYMKQKTKLAVSRKKLALLPAEIEIIRKVVMGERVKVVKEVSRKLKVQRATVRETKVEIEKQPVKSKKLISAFQHRMMGLLDEQHREDISYNRMTKVAEVAKAEAYYEANKKRTLAIALGKEPAPEDVSVNVISLTVISKALEAGDSKTVAKVLPKLSIRATEQGQEIAMLQDAFGAKSPLSYMNKVIAQRKLLAKKKYKAVFAPLSEAKGFEDLKKEKVAKARKRAPKLADLMTLKAKQIDDFLADITC